MLDTRLRSAAEALAQVLRESPAIATFWEAKARMEGDPEALSLLAQLERSQRALLLKQQTGKVTQLDIDAVRRLQRQAQTNDAIAAYVEAQQKARAYLPTVNLKISELLGFDFFRLATPGSL